MAFPRVVGTSLLAAAVALGALPRTASAETAASVTTPQRSVDWSVINDSEPLVRVDAYGGTAQAIGGTPVPVFGLRAAATFSHILHSGATATFFAPPKSGNNGILWSPALEIGLDPPTGAFEVRPILGAGALFGSSEVLPTFYPALTLGYRDVRRKFFIGGEARVNFLSTIQLVFLPSNISTMAVLGGYL